MSLYSHKIVQSDMERLTSDRSVPFEKLKGKTIFITGATGMLAYYMVCAVMYLNEKQGFNTHVIRLSETKQRQKQNSRNF